MWVVNYAMGAAMALLCAYCIRMMLVLWSDDSVMQKVMSVTMVAACAFYAFLNFSSARHVPEAEPHWRLPPTVTP